MRHIHSFLASVLFAVVLFAAPSAHAGNIKMIFWYPGEAGSTEEAQPVLDELFKYLDGKISPDRISGKYFNTVEGGLSYIKKERPPVGILSYAAWVQNKNKLGGANVLLATLPSPHGSSTEKYSMVVCEGAGTSGGPILLSEPLTISFVRENLFPDIPADAKIESTPQLLMKLKQIGEGKLVATAILTPTEAASLAKLSAPWAKALKVKAESKPVPTARVVVFDSSWKEAAKLKAALIAAGRDPQAKDILNEMRLVGFAEN